jgi:hypothetical protein
MIKALQIEKAILGEVSVAGLSDYRAVRTELTLDDYQAVPGKTVMTARFPDFSSVVAVTTEDDSFRSGEATVTFVIRNTAEIYKNHISRVSDDSTIDPKTGDLKVFMKRIDGRWYWNPFGW